MFLDYLLGLSFEEALIVFIAFGVSVVVALVAHEYMHAWMAVKQGDLTPKAYGRLTLNPMAHFDIIGLLCFIFAGFGWAKPVPINSLNFYRYKKGVILVSISGVLTNLVLSFISVGLFVITAKYLTETGVLFDFLYHLFSFSASINIFLAIFNLLPIYPLDGFNLLNAFVRYDNKFVDFMMRYGWIILLMLILSTILPRFISFVGDIVIGLESDFWNFIFA